MFQTLKKKRETVDVCTCVTMMYTCSLEIWLSAQWPKEVTLAMLQAIVVFRYIGQFLTVPRANYGIQSLIGYKELAELCYALLHYTVCGTVWHCTVPYCTVMCRDCNVLYTGTVLYPTVMCCIALCWAYCTLLQ